MLLNLEKLLLIFLSFQIISCAQLEKSKDKVEHVYTIQNTDKLKADYKRFVDSYNEKGTDLASFFEDEFVLETIRPNSDHREIDSLYEVKKHGIRKSLFGAKFQSLEIAMLKPWVLVKIKREVKGVKVTDAALMQFENGKIRKIVNFWSNQHYAAFFKGSPNKTTEKEILKALKYMKDGYNKKDLESALKVIPDYIVFLKMNPEGVRDISLTGEERKSFLSNLINSGEMWDSIEKTQFILPPYSFQHSQIAQQGIVKTERIVVRRFDDGKLKFTVNFVGDEEHRLHLEVDFYVDNPLYNYKYLRR